MTHESRDAAVRGSRLAAEFQQTGRLTVLDNAIAELRLAVQLSPADDPDLPDLLSNLGACLGMRGERAGRDVTLAREAAEVLERAVQLLPPETAGGIESNLGLARLEVYRCTDEVTDLERAITTLRGAIAHQSGDDRQTGMSLSNLSIALRAHFNRTGSEESLDEAVLTARRAVEISPPGFGGLRNFLNNLAAALSDRFMLNREISDSDEAIAVYQAIVAGTAEHVPRRAGALYDLGLALCRRSYQTSRREDIDAGVAYLRQSVDASSDDDPSQATRLGTLSSYLLHRNEQLGDPIDLVEASGFADQAIEKTPKSSPQRRIHLDTASRVNLRLYQRGARSEDLERAAALVREAIDLTPEGHPDLIDELSTYGAVLAALAAQGEPDLLDLAVDTHRRAAELSPKDNSALLSNLAASLRQRFERDHSTADRDAMMDALRRAGLALTGDDPAKASILSNLGDALHARYSVDGNVVDLDDALAAKIAASRVAGAPAELRVRAALDWAQWAVWTRRYDAALDGFATAVGLMEEVVWSGLDQGTKEKQLWWLARVPSEAASCAIKVGDGARALELLERGRSVLWTHAVHLRIDLTELAEVDPSLASALSESRAVMDRGSGAAARGAHDIGTSLTVYVLPDRQKSMDERRAAARTWDSALKQVRALKGFEGFLAPPTFDKLQKGAVGAPIAVINISNLGSDAIIVRAEEDAPAVLPLPLVDYASATEWAATFRQAVRNQEPGDSDSLVDVLEWLWQGIAEPVLTALDYSPSAGTVPEAKICWCLTGPLAGLPVHAAGLWSQAADSEDLADTVLGRVVSSYTPTASALLRAGVPSRSSGIRQLVVGMPVTPGNTDLKGVETELSEIARLLPVPGDAVHLIGRRATVENVLTAIQEHPWIHLACHGAQHQQDPSLSAFLLWDGPLTMERLAATDGADRELAFLSACETATGTTVLPDEALHLAAGMQLAGYRHVIATLWSLADSTAPAVAAAFYGRLLSQDAAVHSDVAGALHAAIRAVRLSHPDPLDWAPFVHFGASDQIDTQ